MSGQVVHFEVPADDPGRAHSFYQDVFGWQIQAMPDLDYAFVLTGPVDDQGMPQEQGMINGGMMTRTADIAHPVVTLNVDDIDAALAKVEASGGSRLRERFPVADMGWAAYFTDTEGNVMGLWQSAT
jgi:predicted enzyme related to lactoylglutathione lyase